MATTTTTTPTNATPASTSKTSELVFHIDDMDFSHYDNPQLAYLCDHRVFVRSRFPKLVFALVHHPRFVEWIASTPDVACASEADKVACVVDAVRVYTTGAKGTIKHKTIRLDDATFWQVLVEQCWQHKSLTGKPDTQPGGKHRDTAVAEHERRVLHRVQRTLKPYRYWKTVEDAGAHRAGSDGGKRASQSNTTRKKSRSIWID